jgi:UDP-N-acetylglucosamine 1-carboxyvinyltransferase
VLEINGGKRITGSVRTSGFKHSLVTSAAAAVMGHASVTLDNCPDIVETDVLTRIFAALGGHAAYAGGRLTLDGSTIDSNELPADLVGSIHGSLYLVPGLVARLGSVRLPASGGCQIGEGPKGRPVRHILDVIERFGATGRVTADGGLEVRADRLTGCEIDLLDYVRNKALMSGPLYGGATKTALLAAAASEGVTTLHHLYPKPDVTSLIDVLRGLGTEMEQTDRETLVIRGRGTTALGHDVRYSLPPDLIEVITWICATVTLGEGPVHITGPGMARAVAALAPEFDVLERMGVETDLEENMVTAHPAGRPLRPVDVLATSRGVFSDSQPFFALLAAHAEGATLINETVWEHRFGYVPSLATLGMNTTQDGYALRVDGIRPPHIPGQDLAATDLRAAAVLLLAALAVPGRTVLRNTHHLDRGYRDIVGDLQSLGADVHGVPGD